MSEKSPFSNFEVPEFKPAIPEYMLDGIKDDANKYIIEQLSIMTQQSSWQTHKMMNIYDYTKNINGKVVDLEKFRIDLLTQIKVEDEVHKKEIKHAKHYKIAGLIFLALLYPLYLSIVAQTGLSDIFKKLMFMIN